MAGESRDDLDYIDAAATFGDRLTLAREALGVGQDELASRLGVTAALVRDWEEDRAEPRANRLHVLAGTLNVSLIWLMTGEGGLPGRRGAPPKAWLAELAALRAEQGRLAERLARLEARVGARFEAGS